MKSVENTEMNVLLLAMSTLGKNVVNVYQYKGKYSNNEEWYFKGISQLEPDSKLILSILDSLNQKIDKIIILASPEAREAKGGFGQKEISSVDFYKERIKSFVDGEDDYEENVAINSKLQLNSIQKYHSLTGKYILTDDNFKIINSENDNYLFEAVNSILPNTRGKKLNLYIDVQGGGRSSMVQMNAIIELLKKGNLEIKGRFANKFNPMTEGPHPIIEVSEEYNAYNLVTAMEIFRKYGRGYELEYFFNHTDEKSGDQGEEKKLSAFITQASNAIQLCDVKSFDEAINNIAELKKIHDFKDESLYGMVCNEIIEDYSQLIDLKDSPQKYIYQVEWCLAREFIQQALTIIESQMPKIILEFSNCVQPINFDSRITYKKKNGHQWEAYGDETIDEILKLSKKKKWEKRENYIFEGWAFHNVVKRDKDNNCLYIAFPNDQTISKKEIERMNKDTGRSYSVSWHNNTGSFSAEIDVLKDDNDKRVDDLKKFLYFVNLHMLLKNQRNMANHASEDERASIEQVKNAISVYIQLAKELDFVSKRRA